MAGKKKATKVEATPTMTAPSAGSEGQNFNAEIQGVAQQIGKILKDHGLGMQATIEIFRLEVLNPEATGMVPGALKEVITDEGTITNITPDADAMKEMLNRPGDSFESKPGAQEAQL